MSGYTIEFKQRARKQLRKLPPSIQKQLKPAIDGLEENPLPEGCVKIKGVKKSLSTRWRIRIGNYRVVYTIYQDDRVVEILDVQDRKDVYR